MRAARAARHPLVNWAGEMGVGTRTGGVSLSWVNECKGGGGFRWGGRQSTLQRTTPALPCRVALRYAPPR